MNSILIKYKDVNDGSDYGYIKANEVKAEGISDILKTLKLVDSIEIDGNYYKYTDSEFKPSLEHHELNVLNVYLEYLFGEDD